MEEKHNNLCFPPLRAAQLDSGAKNKDVKTGKIRGHAEDASARSAPPIPRPTRPLISPRAEPRVWIAVIAAADQHVPQSERQASPPLVSVAPTASVCLSPVSVIVLAADWSCNLQQPRLINKLILSVPPL